MSLINNFLYLYSPSYSRSLVSLLETANYQGSNYLKLINHTKDFHEVASRHKMKSTKTNRKWLRFVRLGILTQIIVGLVIAGLGINHTIVGGIYFGLATILVYPLVWAYLLVIAIPLSKYHPSL
jgi:hypothetical protein